MDNVIAFNLANCQVKPTRVVENKKYFSEGAYRCQVLSLSNSNQRSNYNGAPYVEFDVVNEQGEYGRAKFWAVRESDSPKSKEWKTNTLHEFLTNCGVKDFSNDVESMKQAVGKWINICFTFEEYMTMKDDQPVKRKAIRYRWSSADGKKIKYDPKYNKPISDVEEQEYINANSSQSMGSFDEQGDALPF
jgi:hypothetical protein